MNKVHVGSRCKSAFMRFSDTGEATLRIIGAASEDDGVYTCVATNELGSVTSSASLRVLGEDTNSLQYKPAVV